MDKSVKNEKQMYKFTFRHYNIKLLKNFEYFVEVCCGPVVNFSRQLQMSTYMLRLS